MDEIEELKILIAILAASGSFISFVNDPDKRHDESEKVKQYLIIMIRSGVLFYSLNYKWPLIMCATISIIISAATKTVDRYKLEQ